MTNNNPPLLEMKNIQKDFYGNQVLTDMVTRLTQRSSLVIAAYGAPWQRGCRCDHHDRDQHHCHGIHRTAVSMGHPTWKKAGGGKDETKERGVS